MSELKSKAKPAAKKAVKKAVTPRKAAKKPAAPVLETPNDLNEQGVPRCTCPSDPTKRTWPCPRCD